jgi:hypothetical protein
MYFGVTRGLKFWRGILPWTRKMQAEALPLINVITASASKTRHLPRLRRLWVPLVLLVVGGVSSFAQNCQTAGDMDASQRSAIENAAKRYFDMTSRGDSASLRQNSISAVAANFSGIETAVKDNQPSLSGAKATVRPPFLLTAEGSQPLARGEFLCGVFGATGQTRESAIFVLNNLPPGKYAVAILDVTGGKVPLTLTLILQQIGSDWKLAGFNPKSSQAAGHDATWYAQRAKEFKTKGQTHNAWLYYSEVTALSAPVDFMSTLATDRLYDEARASQPSDVPADAKTVDLSAGSKTYQLSDIFPLAVGNDLDVVVRYQVPDISDNARVFQDNMAVIKGLVTKYPELRDAFAGVISRAVDPQGHDYGTLLPMKDIK